MRIILFNKAENPLHKHRETVCVEANLLNAGHALMQAEVCMLVQSQTTCTYMQGGRSWPRPIFYFVESWDCVENFGYFFNLFCFKAMAGLMQEL
jgi:hypothetical protein